MSNEKDLSQLYNNRFSSITLQRKNDIWRIICKYFLQKFVNPSDTVVDVACGYGEFINNIDCKKKIAIDLNEDSKKFLNHDVNFSNESVFSINNIISKDKVDKIFISNFLEHLDSKTDLENLLDQCRSVLSANGQIIILGPNLRYLPGEYWDFYDHSLGLTHYSLQEVLKLKNFKIDYCLDKFLPYTTKSKLPSHPLLVRAYLMFPIAWKVLGKQFFIVASINNSSKQEDE